MNSYEQSSNILMMGIENVQYEILLNSSEVANSSTNGALAVIVTLCGIGEGGFTVGWAVPSDSMDWFISNVSVERESGRNLWAPAEYNSSRER
jgi:hypothetical protein